MKRYAALKAAGKYDDGTIEKIICQKFKLNFFNVSGFTFDKREENLFASLLDDADNLAANLSKYIAGSPETHVRYWKSSNSRKK